MTRIIFLPHEEICPEGAVVEAEPGTTICDAALEHGIEIEHACEKSCACRVSPELPGRDRRRGPGGGDPQVHHQPGIGEPLMPASTTTPGAAARRSSRPSRCTGSKSGS